MIISDFKYFQIGPGNGASVFNMLSLALFYTKKNCTLNRWDVGTVAT